MKPMQKRPIREKWFIINYHNIIYDNKVYVVLGITYE